MSFGQLGSSLPPTPTTDLAQAGQLFNDAVNLSVGGITQANAAQYQSDIASALAIVDAAMANGATVNGVAVTPTDPALLLNLHTDLSVLAGAAPGTFASPTNPLSQVVFNESLVHSYETSILSAVNSDPSLSTALAANPSTDPHTGASVVGFQPLPTAADDPMTIGHIQTGVADQLVEVGHVFNAAVQASMGGLSDSIANFDADMSAVATGLTTMLGGPALLGNTGLVGQLEANESASDAALTTGHLQSLVQLAQNQLVVDSWNVSNPDTFASATHANLQAMIDIVQGDATLKAAVGDGFAPLPVEGVAPAPPPPAPASGGGSGAGAGTGTPPPIDPGTGGGTTTGGGDPGAGTPPPAGPPPAPPPTLQQITAQDITNLLSDVQHHATASVISTAESSLAHDYFLAGNQGTAHFEQDLGSAFASAHVDLSHQLVQHEIVAVHQDLSHLWHG